MVSCNSTFSHHNPSLIHLSIVCPTTPMTGMGGGGVGIRQQGQCNSPTPWAALDCNLPINLQPIDRGLIGDYTSFFISLKVQSPLYWGVILEQSCNISPPIAPPMPVMGVVGHTIDSCINSQQ